MMQPSFARWLFLGAGVCAVGALLLSAGASATAAAQAPGVVDATYDRTRNLVVNSSDVSDLISNWLLGSEGNPCDLLDARDDLNGDGCLDVADVQRLASYTGAVTTMNAPFLRVAPNATLDEKTFVVNTVRAGKPDSTGIRDTNPGDSVCQTANGDCTLQAAVQEANVRPGSERIIFSSDLCATGAIIQPGTNTENWLQIDDARLTEGMTIDGYANGCGQPNTDGKGSNAVIKVEISGAVGLNAAQSREGVNGIEIKTANNTVRGVAVYSWDRQFEIINGPAKYNHIEGNIIGSKPDLSLAQLKGHENHREGIRIEYGASYNVVGCGSFNGDMFVACTNKTQINAARNIISGNGNDGIHLQGSPVVGNRIVGNLIGLKGDGETMLPNQSDAVDFQNGVQSNWLGGESAAERNVISGNASEGIEISHTETTQYNKVVGNYFGLNASGNRAIRNCGNGISFEDTPNYNAAYNNVIAGNYGSGVRVYRRSTHNEIYNNRIGLGVNNEPLPNGLPDSTCETADYGNSGIYITGGGQYTSIHDNIIANHPNYGIDITVYTIEGGDIKKYGDTLETDFNTISKNSIYNNSIKGIRLKTGTNTTTGVTYAANQGLKAPRLLAASASLVAGTACANCTVEVFIADTNAASAAGSGKTFVGAAVATATGTFAVPVSNVKVGQVLTSTATDPQGNTSEFSGNIAVTTVDAGATATAIAATAEAQATGTAAVQQSATALAANATAAAAAQATGTAVQATSVAQTATAIAIQTQPALADTATSISLTQTPAAAPVSCVQTHCVVLPLMQR